MPSKVGIQSQSGIIQDASKALAKHPAAWLLLGNADSLDFARQIRAESPSTLILLRAQADNWALDAAFTGDFSARSVRAAAPFQQAGVIDFLLPPNEPVINSVADAKLLNALMVGLAQDYKVHGYRTGAYCFPVGNPPYNLWQYLEGGVNACDGWLFLHQYGAPTLQAGAADLSLRHRNVKPLLPNVPNLKIGFTECGLDLGIERKPPDNLPRGGGYRNLPDNGHLIDDYLDQLTWWDGELAKDDYVQFATIFGYAMNGDWATFDVAAVDTDREKFIAWLGAGVIAPPPPVTNPMPSPFAFTSYPLPTAFPISQGFGENPAIYQPLGFPGHEGQDLACPAGTPVLAVADGTIIESLNAGAYGLHIRIQHAGGWQTIYAHLSAAAPAGKLVAAGDIIGASGATGNVTGPHLHITLCCLGYTYTDARGAWPHNVFDPTARLLAVTPQPTNGGTMSTPAERINASWGSVGVPYNPTAAFPPKAKELGLGRPVAKEYRYTPADGKLMAGQGFQQAFLECVDGDWAHITAYDWLTGEPYAASLPPVVVPPSGLPFAIPAALASIGASAQEGTPIDGQPFYRLSGASVRSGVSAFCRVTVIGHGGVPAVGVQVVNLFPDGNGEVLLTDGSGTVSFNYGPASAFTPPASGPFTVFMASGAVKSGEVVKRVTWAQKLSDTIVSLGDPNGTHTEAYVQFVQQSPLLRPTEEWAKIGSLIFTR